MQRESGIGKRKESRRPYTSASVSVYFIENKSKSCTASFLPQHPSPVATSPVLVTTPAETRSAMLRHPMCACSESVSRSHDALYGVVSQVWALSQRGFGQEFEEIDQASARAHHQPAGADLATGGGKGRAGEERSEHQRRRGDREDKVWQRLMAARRPKAMPQSQGRGLMSSSP